MVQKNKRTSVDLSEFAQKIKEKYIYLGLRNILSAGLVLFDKHSSEDRFIAMGVANDSINPEQLTAGESRLHRIKKAVSVIKEIKLKFDGSEQIRLDTQRFCNELLDILREPSLTEDTKSTVSSSAESIRQTLREMINAEKKTPGTIIEILSEKDSTLANEFRKALGPELTKKKKIKNA